MRDLHGQQRLISVTGSGVDALSIHNAGGALLDF